MNRFRKHLGVLGLIMLVGCSVFAPSSKKVAGVFYLTQWEDFKTYYLEESGKGETSGGGGAIDGVVLRIGWNDELIAVNRRPTVATVKSDWVLINVAKRAVGDAITDAQFQELQKSDPALRSMTIYSAENAWKLLK
jgi:hypothetical protein